MASSYTWALVGLSFGCTMIITSLLFFGHIRGAIVSTSTTGSTSAWRSQRLFLRVGLAAPLLALVSAVALLVQGSTLECELVQSLYEGYTLYVFFALLLLHFGGEAAAADFLLEPWREKDAPPPVLEWRVCGCLVLARCGSNAKQFLRVLGFAIQQYAVVKSLSLLVLLAAVHLLGPETSLRPVLVLTKAASLTSLVVALAALLQVYHRLCKGLTGFAHLWPRFLIVKLLVFLVTVQKLAFALLYSDFPAEPRAVGTPAETAYLTTLLIEAPLYACAIWRYFGHFEGRNLYSGCTTTEATAEDQEGDGSSGSSSSVGGTSPMSSHKTKASPMHHSSSNVLRDDEVRQQASAATSGTAAAHQALPSSSPTSRGKSAQQVPRIERAVSSDAETAILSEATPVSADSNRSTRIPLQAVMKLLWDVFRLWDMLSAAHDPAANSGGQAANGERQFASFEGGRGDMEMAPIATGELRVEATDI